MAEEKTGSLRELMPFSTEFIDSLRDQLGKEAVDRILLDGKQGKAVCYFAEVGPDGVMREFGTPAAGRARVVDGAARLPARASGWPVPADLAAGAAGAAGGGGVKGSSWGGGGTGDSSRAHPVLRGPLKGVK